MIRTGGRPSRPISVPGDRISDDPFCFSVQPISRKQREP
jgi:hypothetical protein